MEVRNLIKANAQVVQVTEINVGDVYKRLVVPSYGDSKIVFGRVTDILNTGEESTVVAMEFEPSIYNKGAEVAIKVFNGASEIVLFPATVEEYRESLEDCIARQQKAIAEMQKEIDSKDDLLRKMQDTRHATLSVVTSKAVTA